MPALVAAIPMTEEQQQAVTMRPLLAAKKIIDRKIDEDALGDASSAIRSLKELSKNFDQSESVIQLARDAYDAFVRIAESHDKGMGYSSKDALLVYEAIQCYIDAVLLCKRGELWKGLITARQKLHDKCDWRKGI